VKLASVLISIIVGFVTAHGDCAHHGVVACPMLEKAPARTRPAEVPEAIYAGKNRFQVEMRDGKKGFDCYGETSYGVQNYILLADNQDNWHTRETLHHEVSHIAAWLRDDKACHFRDEDRAIEHLSSGWVDILADPRNHQLVEFLINPR
jgi:hypothetical protein